MISILFYNIVDILITFLETFYLSYLMRSKKKIEIKQINIILLYFIYSLPYVVMTHLGINFLLKIAVGMIGFLFIGRKIYDTRLLSLLLYYIAFIITILCSEVIVLQLKNLIDDDHVTIMIGNRESYIIELMIVAKSLNFALVVIIEKLINKKDNFSLGDVLPFFMSNISSLLILVCIYYNIAYLEDFRYIIPFLLCSVIILFSSIYNTIATNRYIEAKQREQIEQTQLYELELKNNFYQDRLRDEDHVKEIYHDFKNHLLIIENMKYESNEAETMIQELKEKISFYETYYNTGNEFLDIILKEKVIISQKKDIDVLLNVNFSESNFIKSLDISTIFGNLFDNAIEACEKIVEGDRQISLKAMPQNGFMMIVMKNTVPIDASKTTLYKTTKEDKRFHGFGIPNIKKSVEKYNGECSYKIINEHFVFSIVIPMVKRSKLREEVRYEKIS